MQDSPFENPAVTFVQTIAMTVGGPDLSIFRLSNDDEITDPIPFPFISYLLWVVFVVVMSVLFLNFLVSYQLLTTY